MRFSIRDVLWLTLVVGMATGAFMNYSRMSASLAASEAARQKTQDRLDGLMFVMEALMKDYEVLHPSRAKWQITPHFQQELAEAADRLGNRGTTPATRSVP